MRTPGQLSLVIVLVVELVLTEHCRAQGAVVQHARLVASLASVLIASRVAEGNVATSGRDRTVFVAFSSDDWGRWTNSIPIFSEFVDAQEAYIDMGWPHGGKPMLTTAETKEDLESLRNLLTEINRGVPFRQQVTLTPYMIVGGPDNAAMRDIGCPTAPTCEYRELLYPDTAGGLALPPYNRGDLRSAYARLYEERLWRPQYHGRSHFDTRAWIHYLRTADPFSRYYFDRGMPFFEHKRIDHVTGTEHDLNGEYHSNDAAHAKTKDELRDWLKGGLEAFKRWWGYEATVTAVPRHHSSGDTAQVLAEAGLTVEVPLAGFDTLLNSEQVDMIPRLDFDLESDAYAGSNHLFKAAAKKREEITRALETHSHVALQWHASNMHGNIAPGQKSRLDLEFVWVVLHVRALFSRAIFVTSSELVQIRQSNFSAETWGDGCVRVRNYQAHEREWVTPQYEGEMLLVSECDDTCSGEGRKVRGGQKVVIAPMCEYELCWEDSAFWALRRELGRGGDDVLTVHELKYQVEAGSQNVTDTLRLKRRWKAEHVVICERCSQCRTCEHVRGGSSQHSEMRTPVTSLPFLEPKELFEEGEWRGRTCVRADSNFSEVEIIMEHSVEEDGQEMVFVSVINYDFEQHGGRVVVIDRVKKLSTTQNHSFIVALRGITDGLVLHVCLIGPDNRPLGVCQVDMYSVGDVAAPTIKPSLRATRVSTPTWIPGSDIGGFPVLVAAPSVRAPEGRRVSFVLTACVAMDGRLSLLEETVLSFLRSNTYPIDRYILIDDSGDEKMHRRLLELYAETFDVLMNVEPRTGQMYSIDAAYSLVSTTYVFHCQDDWLFHTKGDFIRDSMVLLEDKPEVFVVWCRDHLDHGLPLGKEEVSASGVPFRLVLPQEKWKGFTFNPGLRRMSDYMAMRPMQRFWYENNVQGYMRWMGMYGVSLVHGWVRHTGDHFSTKPSYHSANEEMFRKNLLKPIAG